MGNEVETVLYLAGASLITATHGCVGVRSVGMVVTEPSLIRPHRAVSEPRPLAHALAHLGVLLHCRHASWGELYSWSLA